jgi:antitoxin StbD
MNAPFQPDVVLPIMADACVSISGLKKNPATVIAEARHRQVAILNRNKPVAYLISPMVWEYVCDLVDDIKLAEMMDAREGELSEAVPVSLDDL